MNSTIREGWANTASAGKPYTLKTYHTGLRPDISLTKALHLAANLEDQEIVRELVLRE